jgi:hypothetical protein
MKIIALYETSSRAFVGIGDSAEEAYEALKTQVVDDGDTCPDNDDIDFYVAERRDAEISVCISLKEPVPGLGKKK